MSDEEVAARFRPYMGNWAFGESSRMDALVARFRQLRTALPDDNDPIRSSIDSNALYAAWMQRDFPNATGNIMEIEAILQEPAILSDGRVIEQYFNEYVIDRIAGVDCRNGRPVILYSPYAVALLTPPTVRFAKSHEMGHIARAHITCTPGPTIKPDYTEYEADCWAVTHLVPTQDGLLAIGNAAGFLNSAAFPAELPRSQSSADRARYLNRRCQ